MTNHREIYLVIGPEPSDLARSTAYIRRFEAERVANSRANYQVIVVPLRDAIVQCSERRDEGSTQSRCLLPDGHTIDCQFSPKPPKVKRLPRLPKQPRKE